jgi:Flp pilus assembly pilin Flp
MLMTLKAFDRDESGAVTVDWVVLSAAVIGLGMVVLIPIAFSADSSAQGVSDYISNINVGYDKQ